MTTAITLETHDWPVDVTTTAHFDRTMTTTVETVAPHTTRAFYISDNISIDFDELPIGGVGGEVTGHIGDGIALPN